MQHVLIIILLFCSLLLPNWLVAKDAMPELALAKHFDGTMSQPFYWVSEKLDGVRCYWNGEILLTRNGNEIHAPTWFTKGLPKQPIDGELWMGRGSFQLLSKVVLDESPDTQLWNQVTFQAFDLPTEATSFEERQELLKEIIKRADIKHLRWVAQTKMTSLKAIQSHLEKVVSDGAEGLILRTPGSVYEGGRSNHVLKMKLRHDAEARVIAYQAGRGKFENMMGAIWVETQEGKLFKIGTGFSNEERKNPPPIGSEITYSYQGLTEKGIPRFASFKRIKPKE